MYKPEWKINVPIILLYITNYFMKVSNRTIFIATILALKYSCTM